MFYRLPVLLLAFLVLRAGAAEHSVSSAAEISQVAPSLLPGDVVILREGVWNDQRIVIEARGNTTSPITFRAASSGTTLLQGDSSLKIQGEHLRVEGLWLKDATSSDAGIEVRGSDCRVTACAVTGGAHRNYLRLWGTRHRIDHSHFSGKTGDAPTVQI